MRFCQNSRREATARSNAFGGNVGGIPTRSRASSSSDKSKPALKKSSDKSKIKKKALNFLSLNHDSDESDFDEDTDFQLGRS